MAESIIHDKRNGRNTRRSLGAQLRQSVFSRFAGYGDTDDVDRLAVDPAIRQVVGGRAVERTAGLQARSAGSRHRFSSVSETYGKQEDSAYNGHFGRT